ncbi:MAG: F0F1 ATP synthase subunit epsilon [Bacillota bacterium]
MAKVQLDITTPRRVVYSNEIDMLIARAIDGNIGIMPGHTPLVTALENSVVRIKNNDEEIPIPISDGFLEVKPDKINLIVRTAELPEEIDLQRAKKAKERAERRLREEESKLDQARAEAALDRAISRINAAKSKSNRFGD